MRKHKNKIGTISTLLLVLMLQIATVAQNKTDKVSFVGFNTTLQSKNIYVRNCSPSPIACLTASPTRVLKKATINALLDWKGAYTDASVAHYKVDLTINGYASCTGSGMTPYNYMRTLTIDKNSPQSYVTFDVTGIHAQVNKFIVTATYSRISGAAEPTVEAVMQTDVYLTEEFVYQVPQNVGGNVSIAPTLVTYNGTEAKFKWDVTCVPAPNYQFQLLRLYNTSISTIASEANITTSVDWDKALTIETGNSLNELKLTITEGTGYYVWRVRQIGNAFPGGIANDQNWGDWTDAAQFVQGAINEPINPADISPSTPYLFYYNQFDADKNWIFTRSFIEGDAITNGQVNIGESINYANGLQMAIQNQARLKSANKIIVGQTIYDYSGRPALTTMPAPNENAGLGYIQGYSKNLNGTVYSAADFDEDVNYLNPSIMHPTSGAGKYYSNSNYLETDVPISWGYPYSRTLYMRDGTSKPKEQSSPGDVHRLTNQVNDVHTTRNYVSGVADAELIRVFGDEAPAATSVIKSITIDPNNEKSISYISKEGKTIATCLASPKSENLEALPAPAPLLIEYNITNNTPYGSTGLRSFQKIVLTETPNTPVTIDYSITPNLYQRSCIPFCATCDYKVTIKIINNDAPEDSPLLNETVNVPSFSSAGGGCVQDLYTNQTHTVSLPPGSYTVERIIEGNQAHPSPTTPNTSYINQYLKDVEATLVNSYKNGFATAKVYDAGGTVLFTSTVLMTSVNAYLHPAATTQNPTAEPDIDALYNYLGIHPANSATAHHIELDLGCHHIVTIPIIKCEETTCPQKVPNLEYPNTLNSAHMVYDFEKMYTDWYATKHGGATTTIASLFPPQGSFSGYVQGEFNIVVTNMIDCPTAGYDCKKLIENFQGVYMMTGNASLNALPGGDAMEQNLNGLSVNGMQGPNTFTTNSMIKYLDLFLKNAVYSYTTTVNSQTVTVSGSGYQIEGINNNPGGLGCSGNDLGYKFHPYRYIKYTATEQCVICERIFAAQNNIGNPNPVTIPVPNPPTAPITSPYANLAAFTSAFNTAVQPLVVPNPLYGPAHPEIVSPTISTYPKNDFYNCLLNTNNCTVTPSSGSDPNTFATQTKSACEKACDDRFPLFVTQLKDEYHENAIQVEGDKYELVPYNNTYAFGTHLNPGMHDTPLSTIYCQAQALVRSCKNECNLTVVTVNGQMSVGTVAQQQAMANAMNGVFDIKFASSEGYCPEGYSHTDYSNQTVDASYFVNILNLELGQVRSNAPSDGVDWPYRDFLDHLNPTIVTGHDCTGSDRPTVFVHPNIPSYFEYDVTSHRIVYFFNKMNPQGSSISPKWIYSDVLLPSAIGNNGCIYTYADQVNAHTELGPLGNSTFYFVDHGFKAYSVLGASYINYLSTAYNAFGWNTATNVYAHTRSKEPKTKPYWRYEICPLIGETSISCAGVCFKILPPKAVDPHTEEINDEIITYTQVTCKKETANQLTNLISSKIAGFVSTELNYIKAQYKEQCVDMMQDEFKVSYTVNYHHYTLYYYDRSENLLKTVPPKGVVFVSNRQTTPAHTFVTEYEYNSLGQLVRQKTPDGGESKFWYDNKGRLRFSQNAKQLANGIPTGTDPKMSYTKYDNLGRIVEVGEMSFTGTPSYATINDLNFPASGVGKDITVTVYSTPASGIIYFGNKAQRYLQNRVSYSYSDKDGATTTNDRVTSYYSYDPHGNVEWLIQDIPEIGKSYVAYEYDLISGSVIKVKYNEELPDKFFHRYTYDIDKRIKTAETSKDQLFWEKDASYEYYLHGPLKRSVIGHDKVQGQDYVYTLQGWLKGMNHPKAAYDPGHDGSNGVAADAYSMMLGYYKGDYAHGLSAFNSNTASNNVHSLKNSVATPDLFNGNISTWTNSYDNQALQRVVGGTVLQNMDVTTGRAFTYDELNRIKSANFYTQNNGTNAWTSTANYMERFTYDANGNIETVYRNGYSNIQGKFSQVERVMDNMVYHYEDPTHNNKLVYVEDSYDNGDPLRYKDIKDQSANMLNYQYDPIGNLISDAAEGINKITWNVYGKISKIEKANGTTLEFLYDAGGKRVYKKVYNTTASDPITDANTNTTYYTVDATGNPMAIYERKNTGTIPNYTATFTLKEQAIYGSDRLGMRSESTPLVVSTLSFTPTSSPTVNQTVPVQISTEFNNMLTEVSYTGITTLYQQNFNSGASSIQGWAPDYNMTPSPVISWNSAGKVRFQASCQYANMGFTIPVTVQQGGTYTLKLDVNFSAGSAPLYFLYAGSNLIAIANLPSGTTSIPITSLPGTNIKLVIYEGAFASPGNTTTIELDNIELSAPNSTNSILANIKPLSYTTAISNPSPGTQGNKGTNTAIYEDDCGNVILSAMGMSYNSQYVTKIYGNGGNMSNMFNTVGLKSYQNAKSMFMRKPGTTNEYFYFTVGEDKKAYYHIINATTGTINKNNLLDNVSGYHFTMALLEDRVGPANSQLYMKKYIGNNQVQLVRFEISSTGTISGPIVMNTYPSGETNGYSEIQIRPDANELLVGNNKGSQIPWFGTYSGGGELRIYSLNASHNATYASSYPLQPGTAVKSFDYTAGGAYIFYQHISLPTTVNRINRSTMALSGSYNISNVNGDVRRAKNGNIYVANSASGNNKLLELKNVNATTWTPTASNYTVYPFTGSGSPETTGGLSLNRILIHTNPACNSAILARTLGNKLYELKDHLSNVHAVISDKKIAIAENPCSGLSFDGADDYVNIPNNSNYNLGTGNFTIEARIKASSSQVSPYPVVMSNRSSALGYGTGFTLYMENGQLKMYMSGANIVHTTADMRDNTWHHVAVTRTSGLVTLYVDGTSVQSVNDFTNINTGYPVWVGLEEFSTSNTGFKGNIAEVRMWNVARSQTEITTNQANHLQGNETGLVGYWPLNDGAGQQLADYSSVNNDAIIGEDILVGLEDPLWQTTACLIPGENNAYVSDIKSLTDYYAFGMPMPGRNFTPDYRYGFNGKEKNDEINVGGGSYDFGGRINDSRLGRWLSVDPKAKEDPDMSPYNSMGNNPIMFVDPDGKKIIIPNVKDRETVLKLINSKSANVYAINDKTGELYLKTKVDKPTVGHSKYYSERLEKAIADDEKIWVQVGKEFKDKDGKTKSVDTDAGGGVTQLKPLPNSPKGEKVQLITISGNDNMNIKDVDNKPLRDDAGDILAHEFVGHAIPKIVGKDTGNAVENENKVRKEQKDGWKERKAEPDHAE